MSWMLTALLACGAAEAGDLWVTLEADDGALELRLPAAAFVGEDGAATVRTTGGEVDLVAEAERLERGRVGASRSWELASDDGPARLTLTKQATAADPVSQLAVEAAGPLGNGLTFTVPLQPDALGQVRSQLDATVDVDGVSLDLDDEVCAILRRAPPTVVVRATGPKGGTFTVTTR